MHLIFITTLFDPPWGGSENLWSSTALRALESGHEVSVFVSERSVLEGPLAKLKAAGARLHFWKPKYAPPNFPQRMVKKVLGRRLPEWEWWHRTLPRNADVICLSQGGALCGFVRHGLMEAISSTRVPYVILARADGGFEFLNDRTRPLVRAILERASGYISASQSAVDSLRLLLPSRLGGASVLHSPLVDHGNEVRSYPTEDVFRLACVGSLRTRKGQHLLLSCLATDRWRNRPFKLAIYGDGPERNYLSDLIVHLALDSKVCLAGHTNDIAVVWREAHLAVQPSLMEGAPQSLLEAMLCRRACVATAVNGIPDWVDDGQTGFLASAPTVGKLEEALERAWENRHRWQEMGEAAREACLTKRNPDPAGTLLSMLLAAALNRGVGRETGMLSANGPRE
jgi:glycosyltransferase involved in cell wall biosynthesis